MYTCLYHNKLGSYRTFIYIYIYIYTHVYAVCCVYIYIYIYIYIYMHTPEEHQDAARPVGHQGEPPKIHQRGVQLRQGVVVYIIL